MIPHTNLIKLKRNEAMNRAIARCKAHRMRALRVNRNQVVIKSYTVFVFAPQPGVYLAACNCPSGKKGDYCKHIAASCVVPGTAICEALTETLPCVEAQRRGQVAEKNCCKAD